MKLAIIKDNKIDNVVAVDESNLDSTKAFFEAKGYTCVQDLICSPGDSWDGENVIPKAQEPSTVTEKYISGLEYLRRFSQSQRIAIRELAETDPIVKDLLYLLDSTIAQGGRINLLDDDTVMGVNYLAQALPSLNIEPSIILA